MTEKPKNEGQVSKWQERPPIVETKMRLSNDGRYFLIREIKTTIKPVAYIEAILNSKGDSGAAVMTETADVAEF